MLKIAATLKMKNLPTVGGGYLLPHPPLARFARSGSVATLPRNTQQTSPLAKKLDPPLIVTLIMYIVPIRLRVKSDVNSEF